MEVKHGIKKILALLCIASFSFATAVSAQDLSSAHFIIRDPSIGTGGGYQASGTFKMYSAGNLNISGNGGTSTSFLGRFGFLQFPSVHAGTLSATTTSSTINASWTATTASGGYTISGYNIGIADVSGGPYTFTAVGNTLSYSYTNQSAGDHYLVVQTLDSYGNIIAVSNEVVVTVAQSLSFSLSANTISFGQLSINSPRYATTLTGSNTLTPAHSMTASSNARSGYVLTYNGATLSAGPDSIAPATITGSNSGTPGTNQFALSVLGAGSAVVPSPYNQASQNWSFVENTPSTVAATTGPSSADTVIAYYIANTAILTTAGTYTTALTYQVTANY